MCITSRNTAFTARFRIILSMPLIISKQGLFHSGRLVEVELQVHSFLTSDLDGSEWSDSRRSRTATEQPAN
jgi:hypothetical protein